MVQDLKKGKKTLTTGCFLVSSLLNIVDQHEVLVYRGSVTNEFHIFARLLIIIVLVSLDWISHEALADNHLAGFCVLFLKVFLKHFLISELYLVQQGICFVSVRVVWMLLKTPP